MNLFNRSISPFFVITAIFGVFLIGCLDAPGYPDTLQPVEAITVMVKQKDNSYSTLLKVNPSDSATIKASVSPEKYQDDLTYEWFFSSDGKDSLLISAQQYKFYPTRLAESIPNKLIVSDRDGNHQSFEFTVIVNTPPKLLPLTIPDNGDTLYGSVESAFLFEWVSMDMDFNNGDTVFHTLEIDGKAYDVGILQQVKQSGFNAGEHKFRIIVRDLYGDMDSLSYKKFYVVDTLEAK